MTAVYHSLLVLGGARSGKSRHALEQARQDGTRVAFLATARALDGDMATRIATARASAEGKEGVRAFLEKRRPAWLQQAMKKGAKKKR